MKRLQKIITLSLAAAVNTVIFGQIPKNSFPINGGAVGIGTINPTKASSLEIREEFTNQPEKSIIDITRRITNPANGNGINNNLLNLDVITTFDNTSGTSTSEKTFFKIDHNLYKTLSIGSSYSYARGEQRWFANLGLSSFEFESSSGNTIFNTNNFKLNASGNMELLGGLKTGNSNINSSEFNYKSSNANVIFTSKNFNLNSSGELILSGGLKASRISCRDSEINMDHNPVTNFYRRPFMGVNMSQNKNGISETRRWLIINPGGWNGTRHGNDYDGGTFMNSRVVISDKRAWWDSATPPFESSALLSVTGKIYCEGIKCSVSSGWADYVFAPNYTLKSLTDVANYISQNKHLPGVPSASEIEREGLELEEMQKIQMEKIEELTLYLIEQEKKYEQLKNDNLLLKAQNELILKRINGFKAKK